MASNVGAPETDSLSSRDEVEVVVFVFFVACGVVGASADFRFRLAKTFLTADAISRGRASGWVDSRRSG